MRTLKKTLALVLSVALAVSLLAVGASAATVTVPTFSDATSITYKEAVDVMSTIGVFNGMDTGAFNPQTNLTREQAAKIICYLTIGKTAADGLKTGSDPFTDVSATRWSAGSIAYCVKMGYVAGRGDGTFDPTANVTGYEFAKMLLTALGYDANIEQFTGASWSINVAKLAFANKMFAGNDSFVGSAATTREQAALYALNTMQAGNVSYASKGTSVSVNGTVITTGATAATQNGTFFGTYYSDLKLTTPNDVFGATANKWTYKGVVIGTYAKTAAYTFTSAASGTTDSQKLAAAGLTGFTVKNNSLTVNGNVTGLAAVTSAADIVNKVMANGRVVKLYVDTDNSTLITNIVAIDSSLAQVTNVNTAAQVVSLNVLGGTSLTVDSSNKNYTALSTMKVNDYVLVTVAPDNTTVAAVSVPKMVTGAVTQLTNNNANSALSGLTVAGTSYSISGKDNNVSSSLFGKSLTANSNVNLYLDNYGYAIYVSNVTTTSPYIWVLKVNANVVNNSIVYMANGYGSDGTALSLNVGLNTEDNTKNGGTGDKINHIVSAGNIYTYAAATSAEANTYYSVNTLTPVAQLATNASVTDGAYVTNHTNAIKAGDTTIKGDTGDTSIATIPYASNVKFVFCNPSDQTVTTLSGVQAADTDTAKAVIVKNSTTNSYEIGVVYVYAAPSNATTSNILYLGSATGTKFVGSTQYYTFNAVINGVVTPIFEKNSDTTDLFYTYAVDSTTGAYTLALYKPAGNSTNNVAVDQTVVPSAAPAYLLSTAATPNFNASKATVVDLTGTNLYGSLTNIQAAVAAKNRVNVSVIYDNLATDANVNTISCIIVHSLNDSIAPANVTTAVNGLTATVSALPTSAKVGDTVTVTVTVKGTANGAATIAAAGVTPTASSYKEGTAVAGCTTVAATGVTVADKTVATGYTFTYTYTMTATSTVPTVAITAAP